MEGISLFSNFKKWHLMALAALSAVILSIAWPQNGFAPLLLIGLIPLLLVEDIMIRNPHRFAKYAAFRYSYLTFILWNIFTTWWIINSTIVGGILAIALNSAFMAIVFQVYHFVRKRLYGASRGMYALIPLWVCFEYLHLDWDLSWPWLNLGNGFAAYHKWIQWYEYTGVFGGTTWILLSNILIYRVALGIKSNFVAARNNRLIRIMTPLVVLVPIAISFYIYHHTEDKGETTNIVIGQPNIDPYNEQYELSVEESIERNISVVEPLLSQETDFLIAPESTIQEGVEENKVDEAKSVKLLQNFLNDYPNLSILIGTSSYHIFEPGEKLTNTAKPITNTSLYYDSYNTALFIQKGSHTQAYHKSKLVPGVEKMPFPQLLAPLQKIAFDLGGTVSSYGISKDRLVFFDKDHKVGLGPAICYESIYGEFMSRYVRNGANVLAIITNDGWWGDTPGHKQHFIYATLRAIETRRSIARSANTGISAFINQRGDILEETAYWVPAALQHAVPANSELTVYVKHGDYLGKMFTFISFFMLLTALVKKAMKKKAVNKEE